MDERDADVGSVAPHDGKETSVGCARPKAKECGVAHRSARRQGPSRTVRHLRRERWRWARGASGTGPGSSPDGPRAPGRGTAVFPGSANWPADASAVTSSGVIPDRMRAIHAPSRSVILLKAGFGYSFFHLVCHEVVRVEEAEHLLARRADRRVPRTEGDSERDEIAPHVAPVEYVTSARGAARSPPSPTRSRGNRSYRGSAVNHVARRRVGLVFPIRHPRVHAVLLTRIEMVEPGGEDTRAAELSTVLVGDHSRRWGRPRGSYS